MCGVLANMHTSLYLILYIVMKYGLCNTGKYRMISNIGAP